MRTVRASRSVRTGCPRSQRNEVGTTPRERVGSGERSKVTIEFKI